MNSIAKSTSRLLLFSVFLLMVVSSYGQSLNPVVGIGQWRIHLPYYDGAGVAEGKDKIYCSTRYGLFSFSKIDGSIQRYSRVNGLSDLEIAFIRYSPDDHLLFVAYKNSNIDLLYDDNSVYNIPEIVQKNIIGGKSINHVLFVNHIAYLSCNFGIVLLDLTKKEVPDTYHIGANGSDVNIFSLAYDGNKFYAATENGLLSANANDPLIFYYSAWTQLTAVPNHTGKFTSAVSFAGKLFVVNGDTAKYIYDGSNWDTQFFSGDNSTGSVFDTYNNHLSLATNSNIRIYDQSLSSPVLLDGNSYSKAKPVSALRGTDNLVWIADGNNGLIKYDPNNPSQYQSIQPNSPIANGAFAMAARNEGVWVAYGTLIGTSGGDNPKGVYWFHDDVWKSFYQDNDAVYRANRDQNVISVAIDPTDGKHAFVGTARGGLLEYRENGAVRVYDSTNSLIQPIRAFPTADVWIGGIDYDQNGNLWVVSNLNAEQLTRISPDGTEKTFSLGTNFSSTYLFNLMIDSYNQKWVNVRGAGLLVYQENDPDNPNDDQSVFITKEVGHGNLPSVGVYSMLQDRDGAIWIGTDQGVAVIYNPGNVLSGGNYDAQQILLEQDGHYQYLLATEYVLSMAVDGANRKWFGTLSSGVYCMSADGTKQIYHFDVDNSPLLDNLVRSIAIDPLTGEVFFGTENGICSFRGTATEGGDVCDNYYVFPNPIRHEYHGPIAIKGLVTNANIKITDVSGQLVYQTKASGGQAIWDGNNFSGERAQTGVYIVYVTNDDGSETCVTKMLFTN